MSCDGYTKVWELAPDELIGIEHAQGTTLRVTRGVLWLTFENDTRDVVLTAGDAFTIDRGGLTLVEAQGRTTVCVLARHAEERRLFAGSEPPTRRLQRWLGRIADASLARRWVPHV